MMENKRDLSAVVSLRDKSLCSWYLFFAHIQAGGYMPIFMFGTLCPDSSRGIMSRHGASGLLPLDYTLYLIFRELAIVGDIYRGQHEFHTQPWLSVTYTINPT